MLPRLMILTATAIVAPPAAKHQPAAGSLERKAIVDALRPSVEKDFRAPVEFVVRELCVAEGTAMIIAEPRRKGGGALAWKRVMSRDEYENGGDDVSAVLRFRGSRWTLVKSEIGATDVWFEDLLPAGLRNGC